MTTSTTTTPATTRGTRTFTTSTGWCVNSRGQYNWKRKKLRGNPRVNSVEECAKKVMETGPAGAKCAGFQGPGGCHYIMTECVKGGPNYQSYTCIVFK